MLGDRQIHASENTILMIPAAPSLALFRTLAQHSQCCTMHITYELERTALHGSKECNL